MSELNIGFGLLTGQVPPEGDVTHEVAYPGLVDVARGAEEAGFDSIWVSEHHVTEDGYLPAPLIALAAMAGATDRIRLGAGVVLAPLADPLRLAEEAATLQLLSRGRLVLALGLGYRDEEYRAFGVRRADRVRRLEGLVDDLRTYWAGDEVVREDGGSARRSWVRPLPRPQVPLWLGGGVDAALERAARLGDGYLIGGGDGARVHRLLARMRELVEEPTRFPVGVYQHYLLESPRVDVAALRRGLEHQGRVYDRWHGRDPSGPEERRTPSVPLSATGDADVIVEAALPILDELRGFSNPELVLCGLAPGLTPAQALDVVHAYGSEVVPRLRRAW